MSYALPMDLDDVSRRLLAARRPAGPGPGGEAGQAADRGADQAAAGDAHGDGFAFQGRKVEAGAEVSRVADLERFEGESLETQAESRPSEIPDAGEGQVVAQSTPRHRGRGVARHTPRKSAAALAGRAWAGRLTTAEAAGDAKFLCNLVNLGVMTEPQARELIGVPEPIEADLRAFAAENPMDATIVTGALKFRRRVLAEFERLLAAAACSPSPAADRPPEGGFCAAAEASTRCPGLDDRSPGEPTLGTSAVGGTL